MKLNEISNLQVPGKTFLVGEYAILAGGECLSVGTSPAFTFTTQKCPIDQSPWHLGSPAGRLWQKNKNKINFESSEIEFPFLVNHYGVGGFGASTAEFIACAKMLFERELNQIESLQNKINFLLQLYLNLYLSDQHEKPSGADLITQLMGQMSHIKMSQDHKYNALQWPFEDFEFSLFSTGLKVQTHQHLKNLNRKLCLELVKPSGDVMRAFVQQDSLLFFEMMNDWSYRLRQMHLQDEVATELQNQITHHLRTVWKRFLVKPCGALGADVFVIFYPQGQKEVLLKVLGQIQNCPLRWQSDSSLLVHGPLAFQVKSP